MTDNNPSTPPRVVDPLAREFALNFAAAAATETDPARRRDLDAAATRWWAIAMGRSVQS